MPLVIAPIDVDLTVVKINVDEKTKKHFLSLGLTINSKLRLISSTNGNVIVEIKGVRIALNKDVAMKILVA